MAFMELKKKKKPQTLILLPKCHYAKSYKGFRLMTLRHNVDLIIIEKS